MGHRYQGSGLDEIWLLNGYQSRPSPHGETVAIEHLAGLHTAIAMHIATSSTPLDPKQFRFLRKELDVSQRHLANLFGIDEQTVSLWERGQLPVPRYADVLLRGLAREFLTGKAGIAALLQQCKALGHLPSAAGNRIELRLTRGTWRVATPAPPGAP